jgi:hypothetical protein
MPQVILKINEKSFRLVFGLKLFRILGNKWNVPGINEVVAKMTVLDSMSINPSFEAMDVLEDIIMAAIENGPDWREDLTDVDVLGEFLKDPETLENFKNSLIESLPQSKPENNEGKPKARTSKKA